MRTRKDTEHVTVPENTTPLAWASGSTRMFYIATDAGREGVWSSQTPISRNWLRQNFGIWLPLKIRFKAEDFVFSIVFSIGDFDADHRLATPRTKGMSSHIVRYVRLLLSVQQTATGNLLVLFLFRCFVRALRQTLYSRPQLSRTAACGAISYFRDISAPC